MSADILKILSSSGDSYPEIQLLQKIDIQRKWPLIRIEVDDAYSGYTEIVSVIAFLSCCPERRLSDKVR